MCGIRVTLSLFQDASINDCLKSGVASDTIGSQKSGIDHARTHADWAAGQRLSQVWKE
jgi:hypothetical protein